MRILLIATLSIGLVRSVFAQDCSQVALPLAEWPSYQVTVFEVTPNDARPVDWLSLALPSMVVEPRVAYEATPESYAADLFTARLPSSDEAALGHTLEAAGYTVRQAAPVILSAPWGAAARFHQRTTVTYVTESARISDDDPGAVVDTGSEETSFEVSTKGIPGLTPSVLLTIQWRQVTGWIQKQDPKHPGKVRRDPTTVLAKLETCRALLQGEALLVGGIQSLSMAPDGKSEEYRELAIVFSVPAPDENSIELEVAEPTDSNKILRAPPSALYR